MNPKFRLIIDEAREAVANMAIDEILSESQSRAGSEPTLRFYQWVRPSYSIGYFQKVSEVVRNFRCEEKRIPVVRRPTGGGLVAHERDLTFSLTLENPNPFLPSEVRASYLKINEALLAGLRKIYPQLDFADCRSIPSGRGKGERVCFETPACYDLMLEGKKVVGSSQRRRKGIILHQASLFLDAPKENLIQAILEGFEQKWKITFEEKPLAQEELILAEEKEAERYSGLDWAFTEFTAVC